jgi:hypothetical protein
MGSHMLQWWQVQQLVDLGFYLKFKLRPTTFNISSTYVQVTLYVGYFVSTKVRAYLSTKQPLPSVLLPANKISLDGYCWRKCWKHKASPTTKYPVIVAPPLNHLLWRHMDIFPWTRVTCMAWQLLFRSWIKPDLEVMVHRIPPQALKNPWSKEEESRMRCTGCKTGCKTGAKGS